MNHMHTIAEALSKIPHGLRVLGLIIAGGWVLLAVARGRHISTPAASPDSAGGTIVLVAVAACACGVIYSKVHHAAAKPPAPRIITHIITRTPGHPLISGWQVVVLVCVVAAIALAAWINRR